MSGAGALDVHVHLAALPAEGNGCLLSPRMRRSPLTKFIAFTQGLPLDRPEEANRIYVERLAAELKSSERVGKAVLLAMDGVYGRDGRLDEEKTDFLISNDHLFSVVETHDCFLPGASINPARRDALEEADRCADLGAVLVKTLPNSQVFDPGDPRFKPFFRKLADRKLALLSHIGYEFSLIGQDQSMGDVDRLVPALEAGATVIAAHGCSSGIFFIEKHFKTMFDLVRRFPNFYMDLSALTLPNRVGALLRLKRHPELFERMLFGTDYPLPCFAYPALAGGGYFRARAATNRFDRQAAVLESLGLPTGNALPSLTGQI